MARTTIKQAIADELESLSSECFSKFTFCLLERREKPFIRRRSVENKSIFELTDALVSNFTEDKALEVTMDLLKRINCNQEAERLESKIRSCLDNGEPILRKTSTGELETKPSREAYAAQRPFGAAQHIAPLMAKEVEAEAKALVLSEGGDPSKERLVLSRFAIQFGMYRGKTFKWLLENDSGWSIYVMKSHLGEINEGKRPDGPWMANKEFFSWYMMAIPEVWKEVTSQPKPVPYEETPLGFSKHQRQRGVCTSQRTQTKSDEHFVDKHRLQLIQRLPFPSPILKDLFDKKVINEAVYNRILALPTPEEMVSDLYRGPLQGGTVCKDIFYKSLEEHEPYLIEHLKKMK